MSTVADYVARIEGTCGAESDVIVIFKFEKKDEVIANILKKTKVKNAIAGIIFELTFQDISFRLYTSGKAINESAFLFQLLARRFGTNNLPDCSNMCHEFTIGIRPFLRGWGKESFSSRCKPKRIAILPFRVRAI